VCSFEFENENGPPCVVQRRALYVICSMVVNYAPTFACAISITTPPFGFRLIGEGGLVAAAERVAEHAHSGGQADPREERRPADEEESQDASCRAETYVLIAKGFQVSASVIAMVRVTHSSHPTQRAHGLRNNGRIPSELQFVPVDDLRGQIRLGIEVHFERVSDTEAKSLDLTQVISGRDADGVINNLLLSHSFNPRKR
jgi:hypothetical protein